MRCYLVVLLAVVWLLPVAGLEGREDALRIASYNLRNYLSMDRQVDGGFRRDYPKPEKEKTVIRESILEIAPDLLVVQEIGSLAYLNELKDDLKGEGLVFESAYVLEAHDDTRRIGALWNDSIEVVPVPHIDDEFTLFGQRQPIKRGLLELKLKREGGGIFSVFVVHLKSKYTTDQRDPFASEQRTREAQTARDRILGIYPDPDQAAFMVVGDLNDYRNSSAVRRFLSRGETPISDIVDLRDASGHIWTHYYQKGGEYSLIDYMLASPGLESIANIEGGVLSRDDFYIGSDHRLVWADVSFGSE